MLAIRSFFVRRAPGRPPCDRSGASLLLAGLIALVPHAAAHAQTVDRPPTAAVQRDTVPTDTLSARLRALLLGASPEVEAQRAALDAAEARARAAGRARPMALSAETEGVPNGLDLSSAQSVRVQAEKEFVSRARRSAARAVAASDVSATAAELRLAEQRVGAAADRALVARVGWRAIAQRLADEDSLLASAEVSLRTRFTVGEARYVDVLRLRTERLRVQTERATALVGEQGARRALDALAGDNPATVEAARALADAAAAAGPSRGTFATLPMAPAVDSLLAASAAVRIADAALARAIAGRQLAAAERRPRLSGFAGVQRFASGDGYPVGPVLGASVTLPFTARRANHALAAAAERDVVAVGAERRATTLALRAALLAARDRYEAARERIAVYDAALLRGAREERESALASYRSGALSLVELLDFERALARAETERLRNRIDAADALADLLGGTAADVERRPALPTPRATSDDR